MGQRGRRIRTTLRTRQPHAIGREMPCRDEGQSGRDEWDEPPEWDPSPWASRGVRRSQRVYALGAGCGYSDGGRKVAMAMSHSRGHGWICVGYRPAPSALATALNAGF